MLTKNRAIYARNFTVQEVPANELTHIIYAFANIQSDGTVVLSDTWADLQIHYSTDSWNDVSLTFSEQNSPKQNDLGAKYSQDIRLDVRSESCMC